MTRRKKTLTRVEVVVDRDVIEAVQGAAIQSPRAFSVLVNRSIRIDLERRLLPRLSVQPGPVRYPIQWTTERQRKAFFATDGFGRGIPTGRTGRTAAGWRLVGQLSKDGGEFVVENPTQAAPFVYMPHQQRFHSNTGWIGQREIDQIVLEESEWANEKLTEAWFSIVEFEGTLA